MSSAATTTKVTVARARARAARHFEAEVSMVARMSRFRDGWRSKEAAEGGGQESGKMAKKGEGDCHFPSL